MKANQAQPMPGLPGISPRPQMRSTPRILVVEDDADIRHLNVAALRGSGYEVSSAPDGAAAWHELQQHDYDLMVTDNNMPKLTGVELLERLRQAQIDLPVIMASGTFFPPGDAASPWAQPDAALLKPYIIGDLLEAVKNILHGKAHPPAHAAIVPMPESSEPRGAAAAKPARTPRRCGTAAPLARRILVVDEDRDLRRLYVEALAGPGYHVDSATDGVAAWAALRTHAYHLLITEHDLPKLTGLELVRKLRAAHLAVPVVLAATRLPDCEIARDPDLQLAAMLEKPFTIDTLLAVVKNLLPAPESFGGATPQLG